MTFKELHFPFDGRHGKSFAKRLANTDTGVVFDEASERSRAKADKLWEISFAKADAWTTKASQALSWEGINKPNGYDSTAVVAELSYIIAEAQTQNVKLKKREYDSTIARLKYLYATQLQADQELFEEHAALIANGELYAVYMATAHETAVVIMDIFTTSSPKKQKTRFKFELPRLLHQLPYLRDRAAPIR